MSFSGSFSGKRVLVTGHTGFKGSWLCSWLLDLGAIVSGLSKDLPSTPCMFDILRLRDQISHNIGDVRNLDQVKAVLEQEQPDFVLHLAAQSIVSRSYADPVETFSTNTMGTMNMLEALRTSERACAVVLVTSDKCYDNVEWPWGYRETDRLGGRDVYSGSKGAAELVIRSYTQSFFPKGHPVRIGVGRAGNVIGGGDWALDRIVGDCVRAWSMGERVTIRSPNSTRPWQHVLEPLSGYLVLAADLANTERLHGEAFNFGPRAEQNRTVLDLIADLARLWGHADINDAVLVTENAPFHEASLLKLNCDKALLDLRWEPSLNYHEMIELVAGWYVGHSRQNLDMNQVTSAQIASFESVARERGRKWALA